MNDTDAQMILQQLAECRKQINQLTLERNRLQEEVDRHPRDLEGAFRTALAVGARRACSLCRANYTTMPPVTYPPGTVVGAARAMQNTWKHSVVVNGVEFFHQCKAWALMDLLYGPVSAQIPPEDEG